MYRRDLFFDYSELRHDATHGVHPVEQFQILAGYLASGAAIFLRIAFMAISVAMYRWELLGIFD